MSVNTSLAGLSTSAGGNGPDGSTDAPSTLDDAIRNALAFIAQLRDGQHEYATAVSGTNTITATIPTNPTAYVVGRTYRFVAANANTGAVTINFNSLGAKSLLKLGNAALTGGELQATCVYEAFWDGVNFQLVGMYGKTSLGASGYSIQANGEIVQWGSITATTTTTVATSVAALPINFPNACTGVFGSRQLNLANSNATTYDEFFIGTTSQVSVTHVTSAGSVSNTWKWRAYGY